MNQDTVGELIKEVGRLEHRNHGALRDYFVIIDAINRNNGWFDDEVRTIGDECALLTSEISELYEEHRNGHLPNETYYTHDKKCLEFAGLTEARPSELMTCCTLKMEGIPSEVADIFIRLGDFCNRAGIDLHSAVIEKLAYNATRGYRHGGKVI